MSIRSPDAVRRVVTGHDPAGRAIVVSDDIVDPLTSSLAETFALCSIWGSDAPPTFPDNGSRPKVRTYFPPVGGFRFVIASLPPGEGLRGPLGAAVVADLDATFPGMMTFHELDEAGVHTTPTIDFEVVLAGECSLELDNGVEICLRQGDTLVQNGTRHRWLNKGSTACRIAIFLVGAHDSRFGT